MAGAGRVDREGEGGTRVRVEFASVPHYSQAPLIDFKLGYNMEMDVKNGLMCRRSVVLENVVRGRPSGGHHRPRDSGENPPDGGCGIIRKCIDRRGWFSRDYQCVAA